VRIEKTMDAVAGLTRDPGAPACSFGAGLQGLDSWTVALDGVPLPRLGPFADQLIRGPGERVGLVVAATADDGEGARLYCIDRNAGHTQTAFRLTVTGAGARRSARDLRLVMEGRAMGRMEGAILDGRRRSFRVLAQANCLWAFGGAVGMAEAPFAAFALGEAACIEIVNDTAYPHAVRRHGMQFCEMRSNSILGPMRDAFLAEGRETREIPVGTHNRHDWLFRCHMLAHAPAGTASWLRVA
jgi:FtsP/CotA-like multicopper oxidase with cupredoxin domain